MEKRETLEVGNNGVEAAGKFADGYYNGNLYYYDTNHQLPRPLTSEAICSFMVSNLTDKRATPEWMLALSSDGSPLCARTTRSFSLRVSSSQSQWL